MEGMIGEIRMFAGNFAPKNWAFCASQIINIASNTALFSILGTTYGGNGTTTFALPDLQGRMPIGAGNGPGLNPVVLGEKAGSPTGTLTIADMPAHTHMGVGSLALGAADGKVAFDPSPANNYPANVGRDMYSPTQNVNMAANSFSLTTSFTGNNQPFNLQQPYLGMNYIICQYGIFPSRN